VANVHWFGLFVGLYIVLLYIYTSLSWFLCLPVASDSSLRSFLESFLKFRSRWYDFPYRGARGIVAGVVVGEFELCRRIFMVLYRMWVTLISKHLMHQVASLYAVPFDLNSSFNFRSSNRDPGAKTADSLTQKDHEGVCLSLTRCSYYYLCILQIISLYCGGQILKVLFKLQPWCVLL